MRRCTSVRRSGGRPRHLGAWAQGVMDTVDHEASAPLDG
jgi:hypothetical protein